ncbi:MAG TPA: hypothetical protein VLC28_02535 [Flavitalea sp.]|nr:hypothetical protein [Flavitalea sp.]
MKSLLPFLSVVILFVSSCGDKVEEKRPAVNTRVQNPEDSLLHEVLKGHDEGMAKIGRLKKYSSRIQLIIDSIKTSRGTDKELVNYLQPIKDSLDAAHAAMFGWMDQFTADTLEAMTTERIAYLEAQKASVTIVRNRIRNSLRLYDSLDKKFH